MEGTGELIGGVVWENIRAEYRKENGDYYKDGLLMCGKCNTRKERRQVFSADEAKPEKSIVHPIMCLCEREKHDNEEAERKQQLFQNQVADLKRRCFDSEEMFKMTFENDDQKNPAISKKVFNYAKTFLSDWFPKGRGLLLYGTVGTGKTYYAAAIANYLTSQGISVKMSNMIKLVSRMQSYKFEDRQDFIDDLNRYRLLIIDDYGTERDTSYMQESIYNIINSRYEAKLPIIVTTNLEKDKMAYSAESVKIRDRFIGMCHFMEVPGESRRRDEYKKLYRDEEELLNG